MDNLKIWLASSVSVAALLFPDIALADPLTAGAAFAAAHAAATTSAMTAFMTTFVPMAAKGMLSMMAQKIMGSSKPRINPGTAVNMLQTAAAAPIIYGTTRVGGVVFYQEVTGPKTIPQARRPESQLLRVVGICGHEISTFTQFFVDGEEVVPIDGIITTGKYAGKLRIYTETGASNQAANAPLMQASEGLWTSEHRAYGIAYMWANATFDPNLYTQGPPTLTAVIEGKKIYDPRTGLTAYSNNAALCLRDYLLTSQIAADDELDDTSFVAAANICDEDVVLSAGGTEKRYACDGYFGTDDKPMDIINELVKCMAGSLWYTQGTWVCKAGAYTEPVMTLTEDDARGPLSIVTRTSRRDLFNRITGTFRGSTTNYQDDSYPPVLSETFLAADGNQISSTEIDLPFTASPSRAQRIAKIFLYRQREQLLITASFGLRAAELTPGDVIQLTYPRLGFSAKTFEVMEWGFALNDDGSITVPITLQEISAGVYDWNADETLFESANSVLGDPTSVPTVGVTISEEQRVSNEQVVNVLVATITADAEANSNIDTVEVQYRESGTGGQFKAMGTGELVVSGSLATGQFEALNVDVGSYDVRARAINGIGVRGDYILQSDLVQGDGSAPDDVTGFAASASDGTVHLGWIAVSDPKLSHYVIRHSVLETSALFSDGTTAAEKISRPGTSISLPARGGTYMVKAYSKLGTASTEYSSFVLPAADLRTYTNNSSQTEQSGFAGTKTGCSVDGAFLKITDPASAPSSATYEFSNYIDTGSVRRVHSYVFVRTIRSVPSGASSWDGISGDWDAWPGLFDALTSGLQVDDTNVKTYISTTNDDPAGSPTWGAYRLFQAGHFSGRAFRYKIELLSTADGVGPAIDQLIAHVGYD